jgi:hydrogenase-4 component H
MFSWIRKGLRTGILTTRYPAAHDRMPAGFRGRPVIDPARCLAGQGCSACVALCLPSALYLTRPDNGTGEAHAPATSLTLDIGRCVMCGLCIDACPADALRMVEEYELGVTNQEDLRVTASYAIVLDQLASRKENHDGTSA